tara:strand:+ start:6195 stop:6791 length:597 start_codon:yes stop_codon:yes gene_type:complete
MLIIKHRINTISSLNQVDKKYGVEIDLRSYREKIIISHDPFLEGVNFEDWLENYNHKFLILNVKEEGLESEAIKILEKRFISDYFFLDQTIPSIINLSNLGINKSALRLSDYEPLEFVLNFSKISTWIWLDIFQNFFLDKEGFQILKKMNYKICLASPELQNKPMDEIENIQKKLIDEKIFLDAVCTKYPLKWLNYSS